MGKIDYKAIYDRNKFGWHDMTEDPQRYEALLAGHYSDSNHFVYELLQNAEDERADKVVIEYYHDKLVFYHDGDPFDEADVRGVSSMLMGTKDKEDAQTIGRFGMGFKSVFKYTYQPEIYSDDEAFKITSYLLPVEIKEGWDFESEKKNVVCKLSDTRSFMPFIKANHLTRIIIPFRKYGKDGLLEDVPGDDVLKKLNELNGEILLFLSHIKNLYWVNKENGEFAHITLSQDEKDDKLITCRIEGTKYDGKEDISKYLKFREVFDHKEMRGAEVSVAYKLNSRADNINEVDNSDIWVYFPTRDNTDLPFLLHGSFETAVSREKLMTPSTFNTDLFIRLSTLIANSMDELAERKLITQSFIRHILLPAFKDEEENGTIPQLKDKITNKFRYSGLMPCRTGEYMKPSELVLPVPYRMGDFRDKSLFKKSFESTKRFVAFNNEREANFTDYYRWLTEDLKIRVYPLSAWIASLDCLNGSKVPTSGELFDQLKEFYEFCSDNRESVYSTGLSYTRSGPYELAIRNDIGKAWDKLRQAPVILNRLNQLVPAYEKKNPVIYLAASSEYKSVMQSALVSTSIAATYGRLLSEAFDIKEFNNFQYVKEKVIKKYIDIEGELGFADQDNFTEEYIEDLKQIFSLIDQTGDVKSVKEMLRDAYIIKIKADDLNKVAIFNLPRWCYIPVSDEGINLNVYFAPVLYDGTEEDEYDNPDSWYGPELDAIDAEYYEQNGISLSMLSKLGLITSPVDEGVRSQQGVGDGHWQAIGEFCPFLDVNFLDDNISFIDQYPESDLAKEKSAEILKLLLTVYKKLKGKRRFRKTNPYEGAEEVCQAVRTLSYYSWLYDKDMNVCGIRNMSRYDLNTALYGPVLPNKAAYEAIGFIEKTVDGAEETLQKAQTLNKTDKLRLLNWLAKDLGREITDPSKEDDWGKDDDGDTFNPQAWVDDEFPRNRVNNIEYLLRHVQEQFYCADPVTYQKVWRQIRVSKNAKADKAYAIGMYTNSGNVKICQMCKKPLAFIEVAQIANYNIEMPQLHLCLCRECSARYSAIRDANKEEFKKNIRTMIMALDTEAQAEEYSIEINADMTLHFTQTHAAEIQEIFRLLAEYGVPSRDVDDSGSGATVPYNKLTGWNEIKDDIAAEKINGISNITIKPSIVAESDAKTDMKSYVESGDPDVAKEGCFITYKKKFGDFEVYDNVLQPKKYPLHAVLEGHRVGDIIVFQGKKYEITTIM
ncbi:MAG: hypothetical protein HUJ72_08175 [Blautia sp.]|nr:hypothetical protein [Blautia sp.]